MFSGIALMFLVYNPFITRVNCFLGIVGWQRAVQNFIVKIDPVALHPTHFGLFFYVSNRSNDSWQTCDYRQNFTNLNYAYE